MSAFQSDAFQSDAFQTDGGATTGNFSVDAVVRSTIAKTFGISAWVEFHTYTVTFGITSYVWSTELATTHPRTGPHYHTTPDINILTSQILGTMGSGSTLQAVLRDLDATLTDLERRQQGVRGSLSIDALITA